MMENAGHSTYHITPCGIQRSLLFAFCPSMTILPAFVAWWCAHAHRASRSLGRRPRPTRLGRLPSERFSATSNVANKPALALLIGRRLGITAPIACEPNKTKFDMWRVGDASSGVFSAR